MSYVRWTPSLSAHSHSFEELVEVFGCLLPMTHDYDIIVPPRLCAVLGSWIIESHDGCHERSLYMFISKLLHA